MQHYRGLPTRRWCAREQHDRLVEGSRLIHSRLRVRFPPEPDDLDRLISGFHLIQTALMGEPYCCRRKKKHEFLSTLAYPNLRVLPDNQESPKKNNKKKRLLSSDHSGTDTHQHPTTANKFGWVGLGWVGLGWVLGWDSSGWVGLGRVGVDWRRLHIYTSASSWRIRYDRKLYRLVRVKKNKLSPRRMPLAISGQRVKNWYHTDPHGQWKRVTWPVFFNGFGLSPGAKLVSTNDWPSYSSIIFRLFPSGGEKKVAPHFGRTG